MLTAVDALAIPSRTLGDYGVVASPDSDPGPAEWRVLVDGPVVLMSSATGMDGRGFRYLMGVWPQRDVFVAISLVKIYATGGRAGFAGLMYQGPDAREAIRTINHAVELNQESENFAAGMQPEGFGPLDEDGVLAALERGDRVDGPGWEELDAAAVRGYGGKRPESWPPPGEPCVVRYRSEPRYIDGPCNTCGAEGQVQMVGSPLGTPTTIGLCDRCIECRALPEYLLDFLASADPQMRDPDYPRWAWLWGNDTKTYVDGEYVLVPEWMRNR